MNVEFKIKWHYGYANMPEICAEIDECPEWANVVHKAMVYEDGYFLRAENNGLVNFGYFRNMERGKYALATSRGDYEYLVDFKDTVSRRKFNAYSSSRPSVINVMFPMDTIVADIWTTCDKLYVGHMTVECVKKYAHRIPEGIHLLPIRKREPKNLDDDSLKIMPSLDSSEIVLPEEKSWQQEDLRKEYQVILHPSDL